MFDDDRVDHEHFTHSILVKWNESSFVKAREMDGSPAARPRTTEKKRDDKKKEKKFNARSNKKQP